MDKKNYELAVDEGAEIRKELNNSNKIIHALRRIFYKIFNRNANEFSQVADMKFWIKNFPDIDSEAKLHKFLNKFSNLVHWYNFISDDEIKKYLKQRGITIDSDQQLVDLAISQSIDPLDWYEAFDKDIVMPERTAELMEVLIDRAVDEYKTIFDKKVTLFNKAEEVQLNEGIKKPHFLKASYLRHKENKGKVINNDIKKIVETINSADQSISIFAE